MAEIQFFASPEEGLEFAKFFLDRGCWLAPDKNYAKPKYDKLLAIEGVKAAQVAEDWPVNWFFVGREDFCTLPLEMKKIGDGPTARPENVGKWYISARNGGATIGISLGILPARAQEHRLLGTGSIHHYPDYWCDNLALNYKAPEALRALYKEGIKFIKAHARHWRTPGGNSYWVWEGAIRLLEQGYNLGLMGDNDSKKVLKLLPPAKRRLSKPSA